MKRHALTTLALAVVLALSTVGVAFAAGTIGNDATLRGNVDSFQNFTIVDTNNPATYEGSFSEVEFFAARTGTIRFVVADADGVITYVSQEIVVEQTGEQTVALDDPAGVLYGSNLGVYSARAGVVSYEVAAGAEDAYYTSNGFGQPARVPEVGMELATAGTSNRFYSMNATIIPAPPETKDACKNGGWETFDYYEFRNQGECVSFLMANENAGKR